MTKDEALNLALDAFETSMYPQQKQLQAITAIKEALAQPEQEPVAWRTYTGRGYYIIDATLEEAQKNWPDREHQPLYTTPPQRKPLTDEEIVLVVAECAASHQHTDIHFARAIEAAHGIKEKNT
jgi:hypothetical protein